MTDKEQQDSMIEREGKRDYEKVEIENAAEFSEDEEDKKEREDLERERQADREKGGPKKSLGDEVDDVYKQIRDK